MRVQRDEPRLAPTLSPPPRLAFLSVGRTDFEAGKLGQRLLSVLFMEIVCDLSPLRPVSTIGMALENTS